MRFPEFFANAKQPVISFEVFPPKDDAGMERLRGILPKLVALRPTYMTVTYGAGGSTRGRTLEIAALIKQQFGLEAASHFTCVGSSRAELDQILGQLRSLEIRNLVALRGDPPKGETKFTPAADGLAYGNEMVEHIRRFETKDGRGPFGIAVAGYPEKHIEAPDMESDLANLKRKVEAGADIVITQLFYENAHFFRFVDAAHAQGIRVPIVPGLLPFLSVKQVRRFTALCGAQIPAPLQAELDSAGDDEAKAEEIGVRHTIAQATELLARGVPGIHFYVLNRAAHITRIMGGIAR